MNRSVVNELWYKMVHSGSRMNFFIGVNTIVFLVLILITVFERFLNTQTGLGQFLDVNLRLTAYLPVLITKPWTIFTYMFVHAGLLHFAFNMLALYWFGRIFEDFLNARQFTFAYLAGGLSGALIFILSYNIFPGLQGDVFVSVVGASACVMAIIVATATLLPDYSLHLMFLGSIPLKYVALIYILIDIVGMAGSSNVGGAIAHLGGAFLGFVYIRALRSGNDWSTLFQRKPKLKVVHGSVKSSRPVNEVPEQEVIDRILDKISSKGYESLTKQERELLFKASKKE
jgi:membrane associated rhomboid family serine protease